MYKLSVQFLCKGVDLGVSALVSACLGNGENSSMRSGGAMGEATEKTTRSSVSCLEARDAALESLSAQLMCDLVDHSRSPHTMRLTSSRPVSGVHFLSQHLLVASEKGARMS